MVIPTVAPTMIAMVSMMIILVAVVRSIVVTLCAMPADTVQFSLSAVISLIIVFVGRIGLTGSLFLLLLIRTPF